MPGNDELYPIFHGGKRDTSLPYDPKREGEIPVDFSSGSEFENQINEIINNLLQNVGVIQNLNLSGIIDHHLLLNLTTFNDHTQYILHSLADAKGDLLAATGNDIFVRQPVGADKYFLRADSTQATGLIWSSLGNLMNADYIVDSNGNGTHLTLYDAGGALAVAKATGLSKFIWVCSGHTETVTSSQNIGGFADGQQIVVMGGGPGHPSITVNFNGGLHSVSSVAAGSNWALRYAGINFIVTTGKTVDFITPTTGNNIPDITLQSINFTGGGTWRYLLDMTGSGSGTFNGLTIFDCKGTFTALGNLSSGTSSVSSILMAYHNKFTFTNIFERTNASDVELGSRCLIVDNDLIISGYGIRQTRGGDTGSGLPILVFNDNRILHTGAIEFIRLGVNPGSNNIKDITIVGNNYENNFTGNPNTAARFVWIAPQVGTGQNISIVGNTLKGPDGTGTPTAIQVDVALSGSLILNSYRNWTTEVGGAGATVDSGISGNHRFLSNLTLDDHTQYFLLSGRTGGQTAIGGIATGQNLFLKSNTLVDGKIEFDDVLHYMQRTSSAYVTEVMADSPNAYFRMGEASGNVLDSSGNGLIGTPNGTPTYTQTGAIGDGDTAIRLTSATSDYFSVPDDALLDPGDTFTLEAWVKRASTGAVHCILGKGTGGYEFRINASDKLELNKSNTSSIVQSTTTITADSLYHHVVVTKTGATVKLYIDNVDVTGTVTNATIVDTSSALNIGRRVEGADEKMNGTLDEVAIYPTALSAARIAAHFNAVPSAGVLICHFFDTNDYIQYDRTNNRFGFFIGSAEKSRIESGLLTVFGSGTFDRTAEVAGTNTVMLVASNQSRAVFRFSRKAGTDTRIKWDVGTANDAIQDPDFTITRYTGAAGAEVGTVIAEWLNASGDTHWYGAARFNNYLRIGSLTAPSNVTAGDLTAKRFMLGDDNALTQNRIFQVRPPSTTPAAGGFTGASFNIITTPDAASGASVSVLFDVVVRPTADSGAIFQALKLVNTHDFGAFNLTGGTGMVAGQLEVIQDVAATTVSQMSALRGVVKVFAGDATNSRGFYSFFNGTGGGTVTQHNHFDINIDALPTVLTTHRGLRISNLGGSGVVNAIAVDILAQSGASTINVGLRSAAPTVFTPSAAQNITSAATTILANATCIQLTADASYTLTGTGGVGPTIADGVDGQEISIMNVDTTDTITIQDQGTLAGSNLRLTATTIAIGPRQSIKLRYSSTVGDWVQVSLLVTVL